MGTGTRDTRDEHEAFGQGFGKDRHRPDPYAAPAPGRRGGRETGRMGAERG